MLALQAANNETGVVQPVAEAARMVHARGGFIVCDAVQAPGRLDCRLMSLGADAVTLSAHKFGGPKGVGALIFAETKHHLERGVVRGGGQERGLRSGTENLSGIAGLGAAARVARDGWMILADRLLSWRGDIERSVTHHVPDAVIMGRNADRLPNTVSFAAPGLDARTLVMNLDLAGVAISAGSACSSGKVKPSRVLQAMGVAPDLAASTVRVSLGWTTQAAEIDMFDAAFGKAIRTMRSRTARDAA